MFSQIVEELLSGGSDSRGVTITGTPGSGKTTIMLQIVGRSCYGERVASAVCVTYTRQTMLGPAVMLCHW